MSRLRLLPDFRLANRECYGRPFDDLLTDLNIIMVTHVAEVSHGPVSESIRSLILIAENRGAGGGSVRGFDIRSPAGFCDRCCEPHLVSEEGSNLVAICDSGGLISQLWDAEFGARILIVNACRNVLYDGPYAKVGLLALRFKLEELLPPHRIARAPPGRRQSVRRDTAA